MCHKTIKITSYWNSFVWQNVHHFYVVQNYKTQTELVRQKPDILSIGFFVSLGCYVPLENVSLIWRRHHNRWMAADLCSTLMATEQWRLFSVQPLLWLRTSVYNGHVRGPVTLTPVAKREYSTFRWDKTWKNGSTKPFEVLGFS